MSASSQVPPIDLESYVPREITVVRRSSGWPGFFLHERRGFKGTASYPNGIRQHVLYYFAKATQQDVVQEGHVKRVRYEAGEARFTPAGTPVSFRWHRPIRVYILAFEPWYLERIAAELWARQRGRPACQGAAASAAAGLFLDRLLHRRACRRRLGHDRVDSQ